MADLPTHSDRSRHHRQPRRLAAAALDAILGPFCHHGCGQRVFPDDVEAHDEINHANIPGGRP